MYGRQPAILAALKDRRAGIATSCPAGENQIPPRSRRLYPLLSEKYISEKYSEFETASTGIISFPNFFT